jgi:hypothetical protein
MIGFPATAATPTAANGIPFATYRRIGHKMPTLSAIPGRAMFCPPQY